MRKRACFNLRMIPHLAWRGPKNALAKRARPHLQLRSFRRDPLSKALAEVVPQVRLPGFESEWRERGLHALSNAREHAELALAQLEFERVQGGLGKVVDLVQNEKVVFAE